MRDRTWVRLMLSGERDAGERFVAAYYTRIERMQRCLTGSSEIARDLTQQTFVKAWQALPGFKFEASLATWLHRIAYHEYTHWLRSRREHAPLTVAENIPDPTLRTDWGIVLLPNALAHLTDELREAFLLYYVQELSVSEVAGVLGVPTGTVKSRLYTARQQLRNLLEPIGDAEVGESAKDKKRLLQEKDRQSGEAGTGAQTHLTSPLDKIKEIKEIGQINKLESMKLESIESGVGR